MSDFVESVMQSINSRLRQSMDDLVAEAGGDLRDSISIQVEVSRGPRGGRVLARSRPGEPPRRETGGYLESIHDAVEQDGDRITGRIYTDSEIGGYLEHGTDKMEARPHFAPCYERWREKASARIKP